LVTSVDWSKATITLSSLCFYVTVRDATARLPKGEGTRYEICDILKQSQFISETASDNHINTVSMWTVGERTWDCVRWYTLAASPRHCILYIYWFTAVEDDTYWNYKVFLVCHYLQSILLNLSISFYGNCVAIVTVLL